MSAALHHDIRLTKCCTKCHRQLDIECFGWRRDKCQPYRESSCKDCHKEYKRGWRERGAQKLQRVGKLWPRDPVEVECDTALRVFMGVTASPVAGGRI